MQVIECNDSNDQPFYRQLDCNTWDDHDTADGDDNDDDDDDINCIKSAFHDENDSINIMMAGFGAAGDRRGHRRAVSEQSRFQTVPRIWGHAVLSGEAWCTYLLTYLLMPIRPLGA